MTRDEQVKQAAISYANKSIRDKGIAYLEFIEAVEWADATLIEKACEYFRTHLWQNVDDDNDPIVESIHNITIDDFIKDFKRYLEK